jgi:hypothetical protein
MGKRVDTSHVIKLDDTNYQRWKLQVTLVLKASEVWEVTSGAELRPAADKATERKAWDFKDVSAQAIMVPLLDKKQCSHIYNCSTAKELWDKLAAIHSDASSLNKQNTLSKFFNFKTKNEDSVVEAFTEIEELSRCLNEMGVPMGETMVVTKIVSSLPDDKFHAFKKAWDSVPEASQTMPMLMGRLRKEELESKQFHETQSTEVHQKAKAFSTHATGKNNGKKGKQSIEERKKNSTCNNCGNKGHWWKECKSAKSRRRENQPQPTKKSKTHAFMIHSFHLSDEASSSWISDSGADQHVTGRREWFETFQEFDEPRKVSLTDKKEVLALGKGTIKLEARIDGEWVKCTLYDVIYIPGAVNLFSESVLAQKGYLIIRDKESTVFLNNGTEKGPEAYFSKGLYFMKFRELQHGGNALTSITAKLWHD